MIKINLLPPEFIKKEERKDIFVLACAVVAIIVLIGITRYGILIASYKRIQARIADTEQELKKYEKIVRQVEALKSAKKILEAKKNVISSLMKKRLIYPKFMQDVICILPSNIWFDSINTQLQNDGKMKINIMAKSLDIFSIADYLHILSTNPDFLNVDMGPINTSGGEKMQVSSFKLTFDYLKQVQEK